MLMVIWLRVGFVGKREIEKREIKKEQSMLSRKRDGMGKGDLKTLVVVDAKSVVGDGW